MKYAYSIAASLSGLLSAQATLAQAPPTAPLRSHLLSAGLRAGNCGVIMPTQYTVGYEGLLTPRFSWSSTMGYNQQRRHSHHQYIPYRSSDIPLEEAAVDDHFTQKRQAISLTTQVKYFLEPKRAALMGLYVSGGVIVTYETLRARHTDLKLLRYNYDAHVWRPQATARLGRQWALGPRWALDTFIGADAIVGKQRRDKPSLPPPGSTYIYQPPQTVGELAWDTLLTPTAGGAIGYRF